MSLSNSDRKEMEIVVRAALEPALHELECRIAAGFAEACDMWANLIADLQVQSAERVMAMRDKDRSAFFEEMDKREKERIEKRKRVNGFVGG